MLIQNLKLALLVIVGASASDAAEQYRQLENALKDASVTVNKLKMPKFLYNLDEETAHAYFKRYFAAHPMTHALRVNLGYPVFSWGNNHVVLQKATAPVLVDEVDAFFTQHNTPATISKTLAADLVEHDSLFYSLCFLTDIACRENLPDKDRVAIAQKVFAVLKNSRLCEPRTAKIDQEMYPYVNSVKMQLLLTCFSFAATTDQMTGFARVAALPGMRSQLLTQHGILVLDNSGFDNRQLAGIRDYVVNMPVHLQFPTAVMCTGFFLSKQNKQVNVHQFKAVKAFNVFGTKIGASVSSQFPEDYKPVVESDEFLIVFAHEYTHSVDSKYVHVTGPLKAFRERLLKVAGASRKNYLRNMIKDGFFVKAPQEFVASMANEYFSSSEDVFRLALQKYKEGNLNQINQFALMASIYREGDKTLFYRITKEGNVTRRAIPVKHEGGLVTGVVVDCKRYTFLYKDGVITKIDGM